MSDEGWSRGPRTTEWSVDLRCRDGSEPEYSYPICRRSVGLVASGDQLRTKTICLWHDDVASLDSANHEAVPLFAQPERDQQAQTGVELVLIALLRTSLPANPLSTLVQGQGRRCRRCDVSPENAGTRN